MNNDRLRQQRSITADRQPVTTAATTCRAFEQQFGGGQPRQSVLVSPMAASVALLERFQQPAVTPSATAAMVDGDGLLYRHQDHRSHQNHHRHHQQHHHHQNKYNSVSAGSALSKSMRYADGWLYERNAGGTVGHGAATRNKSRSTFLGREHFGTAAIAVASPKVPTLQSAAVIVATATATACATDDPYDRVRKNRMSCMTTGKPDRKRRSRNDSSRTPSPDYDDTGDTAATSRRSILECDVNPYDLLRPSDDDDECPKRMSLKDKFMNRIQDTVFTTKNKVGGSLSPTSPCGRSTAFKKSDRNGGVNIAGHTVSVPTTRYNNRPSCITFLFQTFTKTVWNLEPSTRLS